MDPSATQSPAERIGVLLPEIDPMIGEILLTTLQANTDASIPEIMLALVTSAPSQEVAVELLAAAMELALCSKRGHLVWVEETSSSYLVGIRRAMGKDAMRFGAADWPMRALASGPPQSVRVHVRGNPVVVWCACTGLEGAVLRQSEVVALGNALIERWGGRIIEDRQGPEVMHQSFVEGRMTERAKRRADAFTTLERLTIESRMGPQARVGNTRVPAAEAIPGALNVGDFLVPEGADGPVYLVERRVNEDWVVLVSEAMGPETYVAAGTAWARMSGEPPIPGAPIHACFTDDEAVAPKPATSRVDSVLARLRGTADGAATAVVLAEGIVEEDGVPVDASAADPDADEPAGGDRG